MTDQIQPDRYEQLPPADGMLYLSSMPARALIRTLAIAQRRNLDAATLVSHLASEFPGASGERMKHFVSILASGLPVIDALEQTPGLLGRTTITALRLAEQDGKLPEMYQALLVDNELDDPGSAGLANSIGAELTKVAFGVLIALLLLTFMMIFIVPTFQRLFDDFGLALPTPMVMLITASNWFAMYWFLPFSLAFVVFAVYFVLRSGSIFASMGMKWRPFSLGSRLIPSSINLHSLLAVSVQWGRPIAAALPTLARYCEIPTSRRRLEKVCARIERGEEPWQSLAAEKLISKQEAGALSLTKSGPTQAWLLRWTVATSRYRSANRSRLFERTISIGATIVFGFLVAWTAISVFLVLASLITGLA